MTLSVRRRAGSPARGRALAAGLAVALALGGGQLFAANATNGRHRPASQPAHPAPVAQDLRAAATKGGQPGPAPKPAAWPLPAAADVPLVSAGTAPAKAAFPVSLRQATMHAAATTAPTVHVQMLDHATAAKAGVAGVLFALTPNQGSSVGPVDATLDYSTFGATIGADFGDRLRLVRLPACALTTPHVRACQVQTPITGARNDHAHHTLTARIDLSAPQTQTAQTTMMMAATSSSSGSGGDFTATSLGPTGTWSVGGSTGGFNWTYPIALPPVAAGSAPDVALTYASNLVDGRTGTTNNQSSWVGEGWDYTPGFVERTYRSCSTFTDLPSSSQTGDQCWSGQVLTMSLHGKSTPLVYDDATHTLHEQTDSGDRVELLTGAANGALNGEYFRITTPDGTQYYFGRNGGPGAGATNSTFTAPVYGAHSGDPCYSSTGFSASSCTQGWRWNLDFVEDVHHNAMMYYYTPETNYYGQNNSTGGTNYVRGGYLTRIDYGLRDENGTVYGSAAPDQVLFTVAERCIPTSTFSCDPSQMTTANASYWPDVPVDQQCTAGATCNVHSPTFWSTKRLTNISTRYTTGTAYTKVDSYDLSQAFPSNADPELWVNSITRTGYDSTGASLSLLPTTFYGQAMVNRVPNYDSLPGMPHWRLTSINTDTGSVVNVSYSTSCSTTTIPADPSQNTSQCMPVYWMPQLYSGPILDYFNKYVVTEVDAQDPGKYTAASSPMKKTMYAYVGGAAWHYDDTEVVKPANRTWGQFRGYGEVDIRTGNSSNGETLTKTATTYFRGMNGDPLPNNGTRSATVTDSLGETVNDDNALSGRAFEATTYNGDGGARLSRAISNPAVVATNGTRSRAGLPALTATMARKVKNRTLTDLASGAVRTVTSATGYDSFGRAISDDESGDGVPELCTTTAWADNTSAWVRDRASETITSQQACPASGTTQTNVQADTRTYYDGSTTLGALPGAGDPTRVDTLNTGGFFTASTTAYDTSGRVLSVADALSRTTTTAYTPTDGGVLTQTVGTNALGQKTTTVLNPDRGTKASATDIAGHVTSATYDQLGRVTQVWKPGRAQGQVPPNTTFSYLVQAPSPNVVTENDLVDYGGGTNYVTTTRLYDALGRQIETQTAAENGGSQVADTFYDGHGWVVTTNDHYLVGALPSATLQSPSMAVTAIDGRTVNTLDGDGRITATTRYRDGVVTQTGQTVYGGDRITVFPPQGGTIQTAVTDARGRSVEMDQYTSAPTVSGNVVSGGTSQATLYTNDALGRPVKMTSGGSTWQFTLDMLGDKTGQQSPDTGSTSWVYDNVGQITSTTDARGQTLAYAYDAVGRRTAEYSGSATGTKLASWLYDTLQAGKPTNETRYTPTGNYITGATGYDGQGNAVGQLTVVPAAETGLNGSYRTTYGYSSTNLLLTVTPAVISGMPGEIITNSYDKFGNPVGMQGTSVVASQTLSGYGQPAQITYGPPTNHATMQYTYDAQTLKVTDANLSAQVATPQLDDSVYSYDAYGHVTSIKDTQGPTGSPVDDQCYGYDALGRLSQAWTSAPADCSQNPSTAGNTVVGGSTPYWSTWTFDRAGDRLSQTAHALPGSTGPDQTTTYTYNNASGGHSLAGTTGGPGGSTGYTYDAAGNTLTRTLPSGSQSLTWNEEGRSSSASTPVGTTSWVDNADGGELVRHDPGSTTLYLPGQDVTRDNSTGTKTAKRYYKLGTGLVAVSDGTTAGTEYLVGDHHGTQQLAVNTTTLALTRRSFDPYGNARGAVAGGTWPDNHGFLNMPLSSGTGLVDVGAREYDPTIGKFISADPLLDTLDPQSMTGYSYADNAPTSSSDPTGLMRDPIGDGGGDSGGCGCDDWWNDPSMNQGPGTVTWSDPAPGTPNMTVGDKWWQDDDSTTHYCDGCNSGTLVTDFPKGVTPPDDPTGDKKDLASTWTVQTGSYVDKDLTHAIGPFDPGEDGMFTIQLSTASGEMVTHAFAKMFGANFGGDIGKTGLNFGINGSFTWTDTNQKNLSTGLGIPLKTKARQDQYVGIVPYGTRTAFRTTYVYKDGHTTTQDWTTFNMTSVALHAFNAVDHPQLTAAPGLDLGLPGNGQSPAPNSSSSPQPDSTPSPDNGGGD